METRPPSQDQPAPPSYSRSSHASAGHVAPGIDIDDVGGFEHDARAIAVHRADMRRLRKIRCSARRTRHRIPIAVTLPVAPTSSARIAVDDFQPRTPKRVILFSIREARGDGRLRRSESCRFRDAPRQQGGLTVPLNRYSRFQLFAVSLFAASGLRLLRACRDNTGSFTVGAFARAWVMLNLVYHPRPSSS